jgi:polar amino acid transport system substrate-binding protein
MHYRPTYNFGFSILFLKTVFAFFLICAINGILAKPAMSFDGEIINICNDDAEWPPYAFLLRDKVDGSKTSRIVGYDLDFLNRVFKKHKLKYSYELTPWKRCLNEVEKGGTHVMLTSAAYSKERDKKYLLTDAYYTVQPHYFYTYSNHPEGLIIKHRKDFTRYRVCGLRGYNYKNFGIPLIDLDIGAKTFEQVIKKTKRERCDIFLARFEIFVGFKHVGKNYIRLHNLATEPMPDVPGDKFHIMISRNYPHAEKLRDIINQEIRELRASGEDKVLMSRYID